MHDDHEPLDAVLGEALKTLHDTPPVQDLWPAIAPQLSMRRPKGSVLLRWPTALAAGIAIAVASAGGTMYLLKHQGTVPPSANVGPATVSPVAFTAADSTLDRAILDIERALRTNMSQLDARTRGGIERSLAVIDQAIADAAARRAAAPDDPRVERYLTATLRKKLNMLRTVSTLTARRS